MLDGEAYQQAGEYSRQKLIDLLVEITKGAGLFDNPGLQVDEIFNILFEEFAGSRAHGILRNSIFELLKIFIAKSPLANVEKLRLDDRKWVERHFPRIMENSREQNAVNMDERLGHESHLLIELEQRLPDLFERFDHNFGIGLKQLKDKYNKPLAEEAKKNTYNDFDEEDDGQVIFRSTGITELPGEMKRVMVGRDKNIPLMPLRYMTEAKRARIDPKSLDIEMEKKLVTPIEEE